jgi:hypothetical protein
MKKLKLSNMPNYLMEELVFKPGGLDSEGHVASL